MILNLNRWSIRKKVLGFACSLVMGGGAILALNIAVVKFTERELAVAGNAAEVERAFNGLLGGYQGRSLALAGLIASGGGEEFLNAYRASRDFEKEHLDELARLRQSDDVKSVLSGIHARTQKELDPLSEKLISIAKTRPVAESLEFYKREFAPAVAQVEKAANSGISVAEAEMVAAQKNVEKTAKLGALILSLAIIGGTVFGFIMAWWMGSWLGRLLGGAIGRLESESAKAKRATADIRGAAEKLATSVGAQAAALQETAASVEEMNSMISRSAENANQSGEVSTTAVQVASKGKAAAEEMVRAIHEINDSNTRIMGAIEESNQKITEITKVIAEIGNRTKVINDIVFQTKLLSFNASVEAARAGEHGKGFAVVAEEVGNLAQMSGNAAKEIAEMLDASIRKVEGIVTETRTRVESLIGEGKAKVATGTRIAEQSGQVLDEILQQVNRVNSNVNEISVAAREQASGVSEINKAVGSLDSETQKNAGISTQIASSARDLAEQTQVLRQVVHQLEDVVWGEGVKNDGPVGAREVTPTAPKTSSEVSTNAAPSPSRAAPVTKPQAKPQTGPKIGPKTEGAGKPFARSASVDTAPRQKNKVASSPNFGPGPVISAALAEDGLPAENDPRFKEL